MAHSLIPAAFLTGSVYDVTEQDEIDLIAAARAIDEDFDAEDGTDRTIYEKALGILDAHERRLRLLPGGLA